MSIGDPSKSQLGNKNIEFAKIKKLKKLVLMSEPAQKFKNINILCKNIL